MANQFTYNEQKISSGDQVRITFGEGNPFEGTLIKIRGNNENRMITVRRIGAIGVGIERVFPLASPNLKKIELKKTGKVRRSKLYYLRTKTKKEIKKITR